MKKISIAPFYSLLLVGGLLMGTAHASFANTGSGNGAQPAETKKKAQGGGQIRFLPGSAETVKERSNRLKRECKGQVNAGACSGHTG